MEKQYKVDRQWHIKSHVKKHQLLSGATSLTSSVETADIARGRMGAGVLVL